MESRDFLLLAEFILFASLMVSAYYYAALPSRIAVHWGISGEASGYAPKSNILWYPVLYMVIVLIIWALPFTDPLRKNVERFRKTYDVFVVLLALFLAAVQFLILGYNLVWIKDVSAAVLVLTGVLLVAAGYLMYVSEPNWFIGFRTPWTISSPRVWRRVNRVAGIVFAVFGVLFAITGLTSPQKSIYLVFALLGIVLVLLVWSYLLYREEQR